MRIRRAAIVAYVVVQLAVPAVRLMHTGPTRFGWQMFARAVKQPLIRVSLGDHVDSVAVTAQLVAIRADIQLPPDLAAQICAHYPSATAVQIGEAPQVACH